MLLVTFRAAGNLYGIDARRVVEIVPRVTPRPVPHAPAEWLGVLSYRGRVIPVLDFSILTGGSPARAVLSTRALVVNGGDDRLLALIAEDVSRVRTVEFDPNAKTFLSHLTAPYLGDVLRIDEELVQLVAPERLLGTGSEARLSGLSRESG
jgi:chemotaxis-related protein WspB